MMLTSLLPAIWILALAMLIEALAGWPEALNRHISHPVAWLGRLIAPMERWNNFGPPRKRFYSGALMTVFFVLLAGMVAWWIDSQLPDNIVGNLLRAVLMAALLATRNLYEHVIAVARPLQQGDLANARAKLVMIVGRNPQQLDEPAISRAAIETLAENSSDGVVAPLFWGLVLGLPGMAMYKAINTLDSMIGYRNARYEHFGKVAARLDDIVNWLPARLTGFLFLLMRPVSLLSGLKLVWRDAGKHRSPNAGWPESAMAFLVGVRLSGPRSYDGKMSTDPWLNEGGRQAASEDIGLAMMYYRRAMLILLLLLAIWGGLQWWI